MLKVRKFWQALVGLLTISCCTPLMSGAQTSNGQVTRDTLSALSHTGFVDDATLLAGMPTDPLSRLTPDRDTRNMTADSLYLRANGLLSPPQLSLTPDKWMDNAQAIQTETAPERISPERVQRHGESVAVSDIRRFAEDFRALSAPSPQSVSLLLLIILLVAYLMFHRLYGSLTLKK